MDAQQFAYWLQGFAELQPEPPTAEQWQSIREHLALVFQKVTPPVTYPGIIKEGPLDQIRPRTPSPGLPGMHWVTTCKQGPTEAIC